MISFKAYLDEQSRGHLHTFDIDDTLLHTNAKIHVVKGGKKVASLSNSEFNDHKLGPGESYDFREFRDSDKFNKESKPIPAMLAKVKAIHHNIKNKAGSKSKIIMNTARADFDDKDKFLDTFRKQGVPIDDIHVHRAGNVPGDDLPAVKKLHYIRQHLDQHPYGHAHMYDDSTTNLDHFLSLQKEYPNTKFHAWHAQPDGRMKKHGSK